MPPSTASASASIPGAAGPPAATASRGSGDASPIPFYRPALDDAQAPTARIRSALPSFPTPPLRISRVSQLDASLLDRELESILKDPVWAALELLKGPAGRIGWAPELLALLRCAVLRLSVLDGGGGATYGAKLQNLKWRDERAHGRGLQSTARDAPLSSAQSALYLGLTVLPPYLHARLRDRLLGAGWADHPKPASWFSPLRRAASGSDAERRRGELKRTAWELLGKLERTWAAAGLLNFLVFLYDGRYRSVVERMLGMRLVYATRAVTRNVSFEFLNRQLVWEAMTEFLLFLMPLINLRRLRLRLSRFVSRSSRSASLLLAVLPDSVKKLLHLPRNLGHLDASKSSAAAAENMGPYAFLGPDVCAVCYSESVSPPTSFPVVTDPSMSTAALASFSSRSDPIGGGSTAGASAKECEAKVPYATDCCGTRYCYYCITGKMVSWDEDEGGKGDGWSCLKCGKGVRRVERWRGAVADVGAAQAGPERDLSSSAPATVE